MVDDLTGPILAACLLEVTARKPGNVHPLAAFDDCDWGTFRVSAEAIAPVLGRARRIGVGRSVSEAVEATRARTGRNTNLGMILLFAPLAAAEDCTPAGVEAALRATGVADCRLVYEAIRLARPGGLGRVDEGDVAEVPTISLVEAMRLSTGRDTVARQYVNGFADVFRISESFGARNLEELEGEIIKAHLEQLAREPDSLIGRKCGAAAAQEASERAGRVLAQFALGGFQSHTRGSHTGDSGELTPTARQLTWLDEWLRADGNWRNPGTTADVISAGLFVAIRDGRVPCFATGEIIAFEERMREAGRAWPSLD